MISLLTYFILILFLPSDLISEIMFPLVSLHNFIKGIILSQTDIDKFTLVLHQFLHDFPYSWDIAELLFLKVNGSLINLILMSSIIPSFRM